MVTRTDALAETHALPGLGFLVKPVDQPQLSQRPWVTGTGRDWRCAFQGHIEMVLAERIPHDLPGEFAVGAGGRMQEGGAEGFWLNERAAFLAIGRQLKRCQTASIRPVCSWKCDDQQRRWESESDTEALVKPGLPWKRWWPEAARVTEHTG